MAKPDEQAKTDKDQPDASSAPVERVKGAADAAKRVKGMVTVPIIDPKTGARAFTVDPQTNVRKYQSQTVPIGPEHVLAVKPWGVVTVDGRKVEWAK